MGQHIYNLGPVVLPILGLSGDVSSTLSITAAILSKTSFGRFFKRLLSRIPLPILLRAHNRVPRALPMISYSTEFFGLGLDFSPSMNEISGLRGLAMSRFYTWCDCMFHFVPLRSTFVSSPSSSPACGSGSPSSPRLTP